MRVGICDDEAAVQDVLENRVKNILQNGEIIKFSSGEELLQYNVPMDILFLDVQMPGKNGIEVAEEYRKAHKNVILIFVTALEEYVYRAFDVGAFNYIVKPFTDERFSEVVTRAVMQAEKIQRKNKNYILISSGGVHRRVCVEDIIYAEVFNRKVIIHQKNEDIEYYGKMSAVEEQAGSSFFRTHRAYLVNLKHVVKYDAETVTMTRGTALLAKAKYPDFVKALMRYTVRLEG